MDTVLTGPTYQDQRPRLQTSRSWGFINRESDRVCNNPAGLGADSGCPPLAEARCWEGERLAGRGEREGDERGLAFFPALLSFKDLKMCLVSKLMPVYCNRLNYFKGGGECWGVH